MISNINLYLFLENLIFFLLATSFLVVVGWAWRHAKPFSLPEPLPGWFKIWFGTVQVLGVLLPLPIMVLSGVWGYTSVLIVLGWYFVMLALQILSEIITLRQFHNVVWVMVPYLYLPYRLWQLYEGLTLLGSASELLWIRYLLVLEIVLWTGNYALDLSQLPRLFRWEVRETN
ncbi:hypothetical protein [Dendronalium sp. ChiSLP03b]|uniref:hypothetical protein n=1 Tax=Dendronalium sp. ChiSLP03b TaxID=3075381 RepID=UPI002AD3E97E|nr:hypothetical protein [Dendronalium sp. ChiSLP03b]MDZ8205209.1 hypothetical protein [Dendronalium sp. ChiSLP03b]